MNQVSSSRLQSFYDGLTKNHLQALSKQMSLQKTLSSEPSVASRAVYGRQALKTNGGHMHADTSVSPSEPNSSMATASITNGTGNTSIKEYCTLSGAECISYQCLMRNGQRRTSTKSDLMPFQAFSWVTNSNTAADFARKSQLCFAHLSVNIRRTILNHLLCKLRSSFRTSRETHIIFH